MVISPSTLLSVILFLLLRLSPSSTSSDNSHSHVVCSTSSYNSSIPYASSLHLLLTNITDSVAQLPFLYSTAVSGDPSSPIFGLAQCRPDSDYKDCSACIKNCMNTVLTSITDGCPSRRSATLRYDDCLIRYSDQSFFGSGSDQHWMFLMNLETASQPLVFKRRMEIFMSKLTLDTAMAKRKFAVEQNSLGASLESIYGMAWCTMDLSSETCLNCLKEGMRYINFERLGVQAYGISCAFRYELTPFNNITTPLPSVGGVPEIGASSSTDRPASVAGETGKSSRLGRTSPFISIIVLAALVLS